MAKILKKKIYNRHKNSQISPLKFGIFFLILKVQKLQKAVNLPESRIWKSGKFESVLELKISNFVKNRVRFESCQIR